MSSKEFICDPQSREDFRKFAKGIRRKYGYENELYFPIEELFDQMSLDFDFDYQLCPDSEFKENEFAYTAVNENKMYFRTSLFENAMKRDGFGRMTLAHELEHLLAFKLFGIQLYRKTSPNDKAYKDPEWQAKCFAGELLMDYEMTEGMSTLEIVKNCKVTLDAARYRAKKY
jgi:Zn-dependent peptidase ImmA (M78 family)